MAGAHQWPPRQTPLGILATLALAETGAQRLLLEATGVLEANLVATQASVNPTSPSTRTGISLALPVVMMGVASKLASLQISATWSLTKVLAVVTLATLLAIAPSLASRVETVSTAVSLG